jgi:thiamine-monophosphate kinase
VSGTLGAAAAGLHVLKGCSSVSSVMESPSVALCVQRYLYPEPRVRLGLLLGRNRAASACIDLSDGFADGVRQISEASGVGALVDADALPIDPGARAVFEGCDPVQEAITQGDDYELLFTVTPRLRPRLTAATRGDVPLTRVGVCTERRELLLRRPDRGNAPLPSGYTHFR